MDSPMNRLRRALRRGELEDSPPSSCTERADLTLDLLLQRLRDGEVEQQAALQLQERSYFSSELNELLIHGRSCVYCRTAVRAGLRRVLAPAGTGLRPSLAGSDPPELDGPAAAIAVLSDRRGMDDWKSAVQSLLRALRVDPRLDAKLRRQARVALSACKETVRQGTDLWRLLDEAELQIGSPELSLEIRSWRASWWLVPATLTVLVCVAGWSWTWLQNRETTALLAARSAEASARQRTEMVLRRHLAEMSQRFREAERRIAGLQEKPPEPLAPPLRVAVFQLYPSADLRGEAAADILEVPQDASVVTISLASHRGIRIGEQAVLSRTSDGAVMTRTELLRQGPGHTVSLPAARLEEGAYTLRLVHGTAGRDVSETYNFRVRRVAVNEAPPPR